jgi:hypothetical protein
MLHCSEFKELFDSFFCVVSWRDTSRRDEWGRPFCYTREVMLCEEGSPSSYTFVKDRYLTPEERREMTRDEETGETFEPVAYVSKQYRVFDKKGFVECLREDGTPFWVLMNAWDYEQRYISQFGRKPSYIYEADKPKEMAPAFAATTITKKASPFKKPAFRK